MNLSFLSLVELRGLVDQLSLMCRVGGDLAEIFPRMTFDLTPASGARIDLNQVLYTAETSPHPPQPDQTIPVPPKTVFDLSDPSDYAQAAQAVSAAMASGDDFPAITPSVTDALAKFDPPADPQAVIEDQARLDAIWAKIDASIPPSAPDAAPAAEPSGNVAAAPDGQAVPDGAPVAEQTLPPVLPQVAPDVPDGPVAIRPLPWTVEEDTLAIEMAAQNVAEGRTIGGAVQSVAKALGRPFEGTKFRLQSKLKSAIVERAEVLARAAKAARRNERAAPAPQPKPQSEPAANPGPAFVGWPGDTPILAHLRARSMRGGWCHADDVQLLEFAELGWRSQEIEAELGYNAREIADRFKLLTNDRAFKRGDVLAALTSLIPAKAAE